MIDLHTHTFFSDGVLSPSELVYRAKVAGYTAIGITDHGDFSNIEVVIKSMTKVSSALQKEYKIIILPGIELTYVPPSLIPQTIRLARKLGAKIVIVHGESPVEPVPPGTNHAAIMGGADILAHPGFITHQDCLLASKKKVLLEITSRKGHCKGNFHVAKTAIKTKAKMILNTDTHMPGDLITSAGIRTVLANAQLSHKDFFVMQNNAENFIKTIK